MVDSATLGKLQIGAVLSLMCIEDIEGEDEDGDEEEGDGNDLDDQVGSRDSLQKLTKYLAEEESSSGGGEKASGIYTASQLAESSDSSVEALLRVFGRGSLGYHQTVNAGPRRVVYHHINLPDLADPTLLGESGVEHVLEEATLFVDTALKCTNVLVHCQFGQRRSPSIMMAWMLTKGMSLKQCLRSINSEYRASSNWAEGYCRRRRLWISKLFAWRRAHRQLQLDWFEANRPKVKTWVHSLKQFQKGSSSSSIPSATSSAFHLKRIRHD